MKIYIKVCRNNKISAVPNLYLLENDRTYDASIFIDKNGEVKGTQKMVHVAQAEQFYEQDYYTPSDEGFKVFDTEFGKIGIVVCFDRHYPESIRTEVLRGADLILIPTVNTKAEPSLIFPLVRQPHFCFTADKVPVFRSADHYTVRMIFCSYHTHEQSASTQDLP